MTSSTQSLDYEFRRVVESFQAKANLTPAELQCFKIATLDDLKAILGSIQKKQSQRKTLVFLKRIEPFVNTMIEFGKIVEVFLNVTDILAFVWGPLKLLLTLTQGFAKAFNSLLEIYQEITEQIPLFQSFKSLFSEHAHMRKLLVMIYEDILGFHIIALKYFRRRIWKELFIANWEGFRSEVGQIKNLRRHKQLIESHASLTQFEEIHALHLRDIERSQEIKEEKIRRRKEAVFQWLSPPAVEVTHERHNKVRCSNSGSCRWILDESTFQKWFDPLYCFTPMLWIHGVPGAGKSVLSSFIIEQVKEQSGASLGYFYFAYGDFRRNNFLGMARGLLSQLLVQNEVLLDCYDSVMAASCAHGSLSSQGEAEKLLQTALKSRKTYIILDGLDECPRDERKDICTWFRSLIDKLEKDKQDEIRCLFVSQEDGFAKKDLSMLPALKITREHNYEDIRAFACSSQARIEAKFGPCRLGLDRVEISDIVTARAKGMFIYARCVLEELEQYASKAALQNEWSAESFPEDMDGVYNRIYQRLIEKSIAPRRKLTQRLLSWICQAKRPLRWFEIQAAISLDLDRGSINEMDNRLYDDCKDLCASFIEVLEDQTVELVHGTVRNFLTKRNLVKASHAELDLCLLSVAYLTFPEFSTSCGPDETVRSLLGGRYAFYEYAVACWPFHLISGALEEARHDEEEKKLVEDLRETFELFLPEHFIENGPKVRVSKTIHDQLSAFKDSEYYDSLAEAVIWARKQSSINQSSDTNDGNLDFPSVTNTIRTSLEELIDSDLEPEKRADLKLYYGESLFKCPKVFCQHFFKGFRTKDSRDRHLSRHDRAYMCTFEGCPTATFGCVSRKELQSHMLESHGFARPADEFPDVPDPETGRHDRRKRPATFQCTLCPRRFTRANNLRAHLRAHIDDRPFVCTVCGRPFARRNDKNRHERLHSGERKYSCKGDLKSGGQWGCGRRFGRADALGLHFKREGGRMCIEPLLREQALERQQALDRQNSETQSFPAALLEQYTALDGLLPPESGSTELG